ncbi:MotA/TolQ/ExbB proton channel family protein [Butyrivibrio sp. AE3004]|uniref:MotA/TolQ/ExbB proton channel family protein n=1 Tax=Butyrivibrio sp. AE3004 TaxID=1506994 RepID=UPI0006898F05|nr:MotA/TolQ/ExbB proton channel family protein [Butyrivibrio sp. AE3004]
MKRNYNWGFGLIVLYIGMFVVCQILTNIDGVSKTSRQINYGLFIIAGLIFIAAFIYFSKIYRITKDLHKAAKKIKSDFDQKNAYLWDDYKQIPPESFFKATELRSAYKAYSIEAKRLESKTGGSFRCNIEDFINRELIDVTIKKNLFNLVPGTMTGLGILGTFLGLSLGLQEFNTGSAAEISESIAPLMDGIKVAFHTSIYGMVFSLVFNFLYKQIIEDAYSRLGQFLDAFDYYVISDSYYENNSSLYNILKQIPNDIGQQIMVVLEPAFTTMNETLKTFSREVNETQMEGVSQIVDKFVEQMNQSLGENFAHLGETIEKTCQLQNENNDYMQDILIKVGDMTSNLMTINEMSEKTIESLSGYIEKVEKLQKVINDNFMSVNIQLESQNEMNAKLNEYIQVLTEHEKQMSEAAGSLAKDMALQIENLDKLEKDLSEGTRENMQLLLQKAEEYSNSLAEVAKKQIQEVINLSNSRTMDMNQAAQELSKASAEFDTKLSTSLDRTFDTFDSNLAEIAKHLSGTISEVEATTDKVPQVVVAAYDGMEKSFTEMRTNLEALIHSLDIMQRNLPRLVDKFDDKK